MLPALRSVPSLFVPVPFSLAPHARLPADRAATPSSSGCLPSPPARKSEPRRGRPAAATPIVSVPSSPGRQSERFVAASSSSRFSFQSRLLRGDNRNDLLAPGVLVV